MVTLPLPEAIPEYEKILHGRRRDLRVLHRKYGMRRGDRGDSPTGPLELGACLEALGAARLFDGSACTSEQLMDLFITASYAPADKAVNDRHVEMTVLELGQLLAHFVVRNPTFQLDQVLDKLLRAEG